MINREILEEALSNINDEYIIETLECGNKEGINKCYFRNVSKIAAATLAVVFIGTVYAFAATYAPVLKPTTVDENIIYAGGYGECQEDEDNEAGHVVGGSEIISSNTEQADGSEGNPWLDKTVETYSDNETMIKYHFADYDKAINFFEINSCFPELPGVVQSVAASYWSHSDLIGSEESHYDRIDLIVTTIKSDYQMNGGTYSLSEYYIVGPVADNAFIAQNLYETQNERTYVNQNGITLTLVDGYEEEKENRVADEMVTKVLLAHEHYMGAITFSGMKEKDIQKVLDYFDINE